MDIGKKLKDARNQAGFTQEQIAEKIHVSRQTISNWENEKFYPDIVSIIKLSELYSISLDVLLKGDAKMMEHLEESTDVVKSNKKLIATIIANGLLLIFLFALSSFIAHNYYYLIAVFILATLTTTTLFYQIIKKL